MFRRIRNLINEGKLSEAIEEAIILTNHSEASVRAEAFLHLAECEAKQGDCTAAEATLRKALDLAPTDSDTFQRATFNLGNIYLRRHEVSLAEQVFLETLARYPGESKTAYRAQYGLGQVFEAQRRWELAADAYHRAAEGYGQIGEFAKALKATLCQAWALLSAGNVKDVGAVLARCEPFLAHGSDTEYQIQESLTAYYLYRSGDHAQAVELCTTLILRTGPSAWATCLAAITSGWLACESGLASQAQQALQLADSLMLDASRESGSTDIINLVNELRIRAA